MEHMGNRIQMKIFVSGLYCGGKTTFAKKMSKTNNLKYIDFDSIFSYSHIINPVKTRKIYDNILKDDDYIIDAIPFDSKGDGLDIFREYSAKYKDAFVIFVFCPIFDIWLNRLKSVKNIDIISKRFSLREDYFYNNRKFIKKIKNKIFLFYDSYDNSFVDYNKFIELTDWLDRV